MTRALCRRPTGDAVPRATEFGDLITADHTVLNEEGESRNNHRYAVVPCKNQASRETERSSRKFLEPSEKPKAIHTNRSWERMENPVKNLSWNHRTSALHRSETHGISETAVRRVKEGTSAVFLQSGVDGKWWADFMECYCYLRNVQDLLADGKTRYERRFGEPFKGPVIPFGAMVEYYPISSTDKSRLHEFGKKVLPGIFLGHELIAGVFGKEIFWLQIWRNWDRWTHQKSTLEESMGQKYERHKMETYLLSQ